jgi:alpha-ketoglutarate-dependent taurine dioxygenase
VPFTVTTTSSTIGVEVGGVSGADVVDPQVADRCLAALDERGVVVVRGAHLDDDQLVAFSALLGDVLTPRDGMTSHPQVAEITRDPTKSLTAAYRAGTFFWHLDGTTSDEVLPKATLLAAHRVADEGGDTEFANTYAAYEALPDDERSALADLRVVHSFAAAQLLVTPDPSEKERAAWDRLPVHEHPLVWTRRNGRTSLLIGATTDHVVGMSADEGRALLDRLLEWCTQPQFVLRHRWERGDLVIWDNTGILHRAQPYAAESERLMHRTTLHGEEAVA